MVGFIGNEPGPFTLILIEIYEKLKAAYRSLKKWLEK